MRLRNKKSITPNLEDQNDSILEDQIDSFSDEDDVSPTPRKRNKSRKRNKNGSILDDQIDTSSNKVSKSQTSKNIVGVTKRNSGKYGVKVHDRIRKKDVWLGTYVSAEEATRVYWAKKEELEKEFEALAQRVCETKRTSEYVGVSMRASGKFAAHIRDPIRKKKLYLGAFLTEEEASKAYLAKKAELEKEVKGKKGVCQWLERRECRRPTSLDLRKRRSVGNSQESSVVIDHVEDYDDETASSDSGISKTDDESLVENQESFSLNGENDRSNAGNHEGDLPVSEKNNEEPCLDNQESSKEELDHLDSSHKETTSMDCRDDVGNLPVSEHSSEEPCLDNQESSKEEIDHLDLSHKETTSMDCREEDLPIQKNSAEKELIVVDSSVESVGNPGRCSDGEVLLRTNSGTPLMDCNGYLLGEWSCIDDLSLSSNL